MNATSIITCFMVCNIHVTLLTVYLVCEQEVIQMIKNAFKNLGRNKGRTFLVSMVAVIVLIASACSMIVHISAKQLAEVQKEKIGAQVIITRNDEKLSKSTNNGYQDISVKQMKSFTKSSLLKDSSIYASTVGKTDLEMVEGSGLGSAMVPDGSDSSDTEGTIVFSEDDPEFESFLDSYESANIMLIGTTNQKISDDFASGTRKIKEGSMFKKTGEVLIGEKLAKKNHLKVGDTFKVKMIDFALDSKEAPYVAFTISGIFEDHKASGDSDMGYLNKDNEVFMSYETFEQWNIADSTTGTITVEGSFNLKNPDDVEKLTKEFYEKGMPEYFDLSVNRNAYDKSVAPIIQVADMTMMFSFIIFGAGALIMVVLSFLSIRERKYEIGVLRAMGAKKSSICVMLCVEMCMICIGCAFFALLIANIGAQSIANMMLSKIDVSESIQFGAFFVGSGNVDAITNISASLSIESFVMIVFVATCLGLIASACGVFYITKNEPMRILAERN